MSYSILGAKKAAEKFLVGTLLVMFAFGAISCESSKDDEETEGGVDATTRLVNEFVLTYNKTYYLWNSMINYSNKDPKKIDNPFQLFDDLIYEELDIWSYLTDDAEAMFNSYQGVETSYGYSLILGRFSNTGELFAVVKFVYADSPAADAGVKRGDIFIGINGGAITELNYLDLYYSSSIQLQFGKYLPEESVIARTEEKVSLTAEKLNIDAVNAYTVVEEGAHKIGYICYTDYVESSHEKLDQICTEFKAQGVTDVVLDLRYNPGGAARSANYLSSLMVPKVQVQKGAVFLKQIWNAELNAYWNDEGEELLEGFNKNALAANLDLSRIFILTTSGTASASEATIVGLMPYMEVIKIGETTHGKYCGALLLQAVDKNGDVIEQIGNWAMSLVVYKFANANDYTDFTGGIAPDYEVKDDIFSPYPFGDVNDPHFAKAIELITGKVTRATKADAGSCAFTLMEEETRQLQGRRGGHLAIE